MKKYAPPKEFLIEIEVLNLSDLATLLNDLTETLTVKVDNLSDVFEEFYSGNLSDEFDLWVEKLSITELILFTQWLLNSIAFKAFAEGKTK